MLALFLDFNSARTLFFFKKDDLWFLQANLVLVAILNLAAILIFLEE
jgi:hypothetical protein